MKLKLDENLGSRCRQLFQAAGHDTTSVSSQGVCGSSDSELIELCRREERALVTLDLDFANPLVFRPSEYHGVAVLRPSRPIFISHLEDLCCTFRDAITRESLTGKLWVVEYGRIRIYQEREQ